MFNKIIESLLKHKNLYLVLLILITVFFGVSITGLKIGDKKILPGLQVDNSMEVWFDQDDEDFRTYKNFLEQFTNDEFAVVALRADDIFQLDVLRKISNLTGKLERLPYVRDVTSITNIIYFSNDEGTLIISDLISEF